MSLTTSKCNVGQKVARLLLDTKAVQFRSDRPFFYSSGWASPVYLNSKILLSYPEPRDQMFELSIGQIQTIMKEFTIDGIAGIDGAGAPFASIIADRLKLPLVIVRKQARGIGPLNQIDGVFKPKARLLLVDDVTTDGRTKAVMSGVLRRAGAVIECAFVIFKYGIFESVLNERELGVNIQSLLSWHGLLRRAIEDKDFPVDVLAEIQQYVNDPVRWSFEHGGISVDQFRKLT